ncbi:MAG: alanine dehydrogenase [Gammaproteobacteria bacterium]|jgi:alanine dehydrogenase
MRIGIPTEIKPLEGRVALTPEACSELCGAGHEVLVQAGAGVSSGCADAEYARVGARLVPDAAALYGESELVVKVKEPQTAELELLRPDHLLFCFLHLAANRDLAERLRRIGLTAVAFETVSENGRLPLLAPMSEIAGHLAVQVGAHLLHRPLGGRGILLGGVTGTERGRVVVLGAGTAGTSAVTQAAALGAEVTVFDLRVERLERMRELGPNVTALHSSAAAIDRAVRTADLLVGAVLVPGRQTPRLVGEDQVAAMQAGSVIADISVDQGGCIATTRPTTYDDPVYTRNGVLHFCVTNMPGGVPRTATQALAAVLLPYVRRLAETAWEDDPALESGVNVADGAFVNPAVAAEFEHV